MPIMLRLFLLVGLALIPAISLLVWNDITDFERRETAARRESLRYARLIAGELNQLFEGARSVLRATSQAPLIQEAREPDCQAYLKRIQDITPSTTAFSLFNPSGMQQCTSGPRAMPESG